MGLTANPVTILLFLLCFSAETVLGSQNIETFEAQYSSFNDSNKGNFTIQYPAAINNDAFQVTPDTASSNTFTLYNRSGRVLLNRHFKLWDDHEVHSSNSSQVASFNSSFLINIYQLNSTTGEGLAFGIFPDKAIPPGSEGQYMGLTNSTTDGNTTNQLVAVEFDTFKQDFDPDANHIGLNINSIRSIKNVSLSPLGIKLVPPNPEAKFYNVWVQYDGIAKTIEVYMIEQASKDGPTPARPSSPVLKSDLDLRHLVAQYSYFGFAASTGNATQQLNCVLRWNLTVQYYPENDDDSWLKIVLGVGVPGVALLVIGSMALCYYFYRRRSARSDPNILGALKSLPGMPREFHFKDLNKATNNFHEKNKLGEGGFGVVYKGLLPGENLEVAVKWFSRESMKGQDDFLAELTIINRLRHRHLVRLLGWCHKNGKLLLVYEYMPNGSLDKHLFGTTADEQPLSWNLRYKIISGLASALHYIHNEFDQKVVHRDLKASNIMLDSNFNSRLGDFGLARALDHEKNSYTEAAGVLGTPGYIAPEYFHTAKATQQSDVYAFGAVLLEVVSGQRPGTRIGAFQYLVDWVWFLHREGRLREAVDERLREDYVAEEAERVLLVGLSCCHPIASERLDAKEILQIVSGMMAVPHVPPFKPPFVWPSVAGLEGEDISSATTLDTTYATSHFESGWSPQLHSRDSYVTYTSDNSLV
ncbi:probable L-type lectin-domain containing receptor kinase S.5 [Cornus florida]|uniref:probable L-type lectin-domain containing receptor kinase S.5 n=1 Tax=Cornus florida TaxID=4283 RepID=UPI002896E6B4|nr:probable L-type lectin-domain containing receptor kinase S.5 [Cornus florida]